jgi:hypothetical protein
MKIKILLIIISLLFFFNPVEAQESSFGDTLFSFNAGHLTPTPDRLLFGVEYAEDYLWVTGADPDDLWQRKLYKFSPDGDSLIEYFEYEFGVASWKDLAYDGEYLYVTDIDTIRQISLEDGQPTGVKIKGPLYYQAGLAYDPETDHFWVSGDGNNIYEIDRDGNIVNSVLFLPDLPAAGLGWDTWTEGGPYLWIWSMKYTPADVRPKAFQLNPATGLLTGLEFEGVLMNPAAPNAADYAAGMTLTDELVDGKVAIVGIHASSYLEYNDQLDWVVAYDLDPENLGIPGPVISVNPVTIQNDLYPGDSAFIPVVVENLSDTYDMEWMARLEYPYSDTASEMGEVITGFNMSVLTPDTNNRMRAMTYLNDYIYVSTSVGLGNQFLLYQLDKNGEELVDVDTLYASFSGWTTMTADDQYIYGVQQYIVQAFDPVANAVVATYPRPNFSPSALAYDTQKELFYAGNGVGAIMVFNKEGDETNFYVTPYDIEGLSWDRWSAGGPYLWVYHADKNDPAVIHATRLDPSTGGETGMSFAGVNLSGDESEPDIPKDIMVTPSWQENKLVMIALHDSNEDPGDGQDRIIVYDMDVTPAPGWIDLLSPTYGMTEPLDADTLLVRLDAIMEDTLMTAQIVISSNDVSTPDKIIPVNFTMLSGLPTFISKERTESPLVIFPNPASEQVTLNMPENRNPFTLHIYNNSGQLMLNQTIAAGHTSVPISVSDWPRGIYLVNLTDGTTFMNTRLIKR